jgi:hypothetical protein
VTRSDRIDELAGRSNGDDVAVIDDRDAIAQSFGFFHVMRRQDDRTSGSLQILDQLPELSTRLRIESSGGLVEEKQLRVSNERAGNRKSLLLSARETADPRTPLFAELDDADHFVDGATPVVEAAEKTKSLEDGQLLRELRILELNAEPLPQIAAIVLPRSSENYHLPGIPRQESFAYLYCSGLAGAIGAEQSETLPGGNIQIEAVHGDHIAV